MTTEIVTRLEHHGVSPTRQRREIAAILLARPQHLTAEQIMEALTGRGLHVSKATVYNTLKLFVEKGLLREVRVDGSSTVYDSTTRPHHHFLNVDTGELTDIPPDQIQFNLLPIAPGGTIANGVEVLVRIRNA